MTSTQKNGIDNHFLPDQRVRIAALSPHNVEADDRHVEAQVVLIWPYSSSTRKFSLLLSETDARPFNSRRQLKVAFYNGSARAVQDSHVGIGDKVKLRLAGCKWIHIQDEISTPGKKLDFDGEFRKEVTLEVQAPAAVAKLICYEATETLSPVRSPVSSVVLKVIEDINISTSKIALSYQSPAGARLLSHSYLDSPLDPFAEDKEYVYGRSRKRTKFARPSGAWTLLDGDEQAQSEPTTPSKAIAGHHVTPLEALEAATEDVFTNGVFDEVVDLTTPVAETFDDLDHRLEEVKTLVATAQESVASLIGSENAASDLMGPPQLPASARDQGFEVYNQDKEDVLVDNGVVTTPRLGPLPSAELALVSPLVQSFDRTNYFPDSSERPSELDAISRASEYTASERVISEHGSSIDSSSEDSVLVVKPPEPQTLPLQMGSTQEEKSSPESIVTSEDESVEETAVPQEVQDDTPLQQPSPKDPVSASVQEVQLIESEDEDMYGAPEKALAKSVLDVFEEYVDMSQAAVQQQVNAEVNTTATTRVSALPDDTIAADASHATASSQRQASRRGSPMRLNEDREASAPQSLDGAVDDEETMVTQPAKALTGATKAELETLEHALTVQQQPLTPAPTQESLVLPEQQEQSHEAPALLTPAQSRDLEYLLPDVLPEMQGPLQTEAPLSLSTVRKDSTKPRRVSQRLTRRSAAPEELSSPYFTPRTRKPQHPSSIQTEHLGESSQGEPDTSPISVRSRLKSPRLASMSKGRNIKHAQESSPATVAPQRTQGIQTDIAYYTRLASLPEHFGQLVDLVVICAEDSTEAERAKSGPKDFHTTIRLVDPSSPPANNSKTAVQIFRPMRQAIPTARRGNVLILRDFKVQTAKRKCMLLSTESSAWAVFQTTPTARSGYADVQINGPPVEYDRGEILQVKELSQWWQEEGQAIFDLGPKNTSMNGAQADGTTEVEPSPASAAPLPYQADDDAESEHSNKANEKAPDTLAVSVEHPASPRRSRRQRNKTDNINNEADQASVAEEAEEDITAPPPPSTRKQPPRRARTQTPHMDTPASAASPTHRRARTKTPQVNGATSPTSPSHRRTRSTKSPGTVHELRDGTKYVDEIDGRGPGTVHELRDGSSYVDPE